MPLSRETRFTETRPIEKWSLDGVAMAVVEAMKAAATEGAPAEPEGIFLQVAPPASYIEGSKGSLFTQVTWGSPTDGE